MRLTALAVAHLADFGGTAAACFPSSTAIGSTWDVELARAVGVAMGEEARAKGVHLALAPTTNTARSPLGGRGFESYAEDPLLNGLMGVAAVEGIQSTGIGATAKHFCCNDQETQRYSIDAVVDERSLREIYLRPFELILKRAKPWAVMTSYNSVNGAHASAQTWLLQTILRGVRVMSAARG